MTSIWDITASEKLPLGLPTVGWRPLLYVPKHTIFPLSQPLSLCIIIIYLPCWSFLLNNKVHKSKNYVYHDHYCISWRWPVLRIWDLEGNALYMALPCTISMSACMPVNHQCLKCGQSRSTNSRRCQGINNPRNSTREGLLGLMGKYCSSSVVPCVK